MLVLCLCLFVCCHLCANCHLSGAVKSNLRFSQHACSRKKKQKKQQPTATRLSCSSPSVPVARHIHLLQSSSVRSLSHPSSSAVLDRVDFSPRLLACCSFACSTLSSTRHAGSIHRIRDDHGHRGSHNARSKGRTGKQRAQTSNFIVSFPSLLVYHCVLRELVSIEHAHNSTATCCSTNTKHCNESNLTRVLDFLVFLVCLFVTVCWSCCWLLFVCTVMLYCSSLLHHAMYIHHSVLHHRRCRLLQGPYEDISNLLASAHATASSLASLDAPGPPRIVTVRHTHHHVVPADMPQHIAEHIAIANTPTPPPVRIVVTPNRAQQARHAAEDASYQRAHSEPTVRTVNIRHTVTSGNGADAQAHAEAIRSHIAGVTPSVAAAIGHPYTIKGQRGDQKSDAQWKVQGTGYHFPLVDRSMKRAHYSVIAETDGSNKADGSDFKPHTAEELQAEAAKLLAKAKLLRDAKEAKSDAELKMKEQQSELGIFDEKDANYEDEITRLGRVSARMNRLREQIELPHNGDSFLESIARKRYYLKLYWKLKREATDIIESYALTTGHSIFEMFGDGKMDPSIAPFLPPNSVAGILAQYSNPTQGRSDETPRDIVSGREAKRIQYSIDYYHANRAGTPLPLPPKFAPSDVELEEGLRHKNPLYNKVIAKQHGEFGQDRPAVTFGNQAIGRSSVHLTVVNPTDNTVVRGVPFQINLKHARVPK